MDVYFMHIPKSKNNVFGQQANTLKSALFMHNA